MFYIPEQWIKEKKNEAEVHEILNKYLYSDVIIVGEDNIALAVEALSNIGEEIIIEKIKDGTIKIS